MTLTIILSGFVDRVAGHIALELQLDTAIRKIYFDVHLCCHTSLPASWVGARRVQATESHGEWWRVVQGQRVMVNPEAWLLMILLPALLLAVLAQLVMQVVFAQASGAKTRMSGYAVARHVLDGSGLYDIQVEQVPGMQSDHYDPQRRVLQLSPEVYHGRHVAAMAVAAHEACHALQQQQGAAWFFLRGLAIPAATFGSGGGILIAVAGLLSRFPPLLALGILLFSFSLYLQLLSLPVEMGASLLARRRLMTLGIVDEGQQTKLAWSLVAVAIAYVGVTLQSVFALLQRIAARTGRGTEV